ncbi:hypothetical protein KRR40_26330 [Niabella defluvii]|nr:hypothetical protein KRR40_26330 [Niabella sp. I65]
MTTATRASLLIGMVLSFVNTYSQDRLSQILKNELQREFVQLKAADKNVYYMSYRVDDITSYRVTANFGVISSIDSSRVRVFTPTVRVGSYQFDNTHNVQFGGAAGNLPVVENEDILKLSIWKSTDVAYKNAAQMYEQLLTNKK